MKTRVGVLISGQGSNLQALIDAAKSSDYPAQIALVISNKPDAYGLTRAQQAGVASAVIEHTRFPGREAFDRAMHDALVDHKIEIVCLAGFMRLLSPWFVQQWQGRMLNIHPSLLPDFKGSTAVRDALNAGAKETGATVHVVTDELDSGPIVKASAAVPILKDDTEATLRERIQAEEHQLYPAALRAFIERRA